MTPGTRLAEYLLTAASDEIRGRPFTVDIGGDDVPPLYPHQIDALDALEARSASTILHLPTGSGKTRIATEFIARTLRRAPDTHVLWASYPTTLLRQAMVRLAEYGAELPAGTTFAWLASDARSRGRLTLFDDLQVSFVLRGTLTSLLADIGDRPRKSPLRRLLLSDRPLLLIYDECHQLGARRLQRAWRVLTKRLPAVTPRVLGLSATPLPRRKRRRALLRHTIFPLAPGSVVDPEHPWGVDVAHRVRNRELEELGVLCPVNAWQQRSGFFDIPQTLLSGVTRRCPIEEPAGDHAGPDDLLRFSAQFNARVMSHPDVLRFLAARLAARLPQLGKTLVFLPKIKTADALVELLEAHPATKGRTYVVHSRVGVDDHERDIPRHGIYHQLSAFAARGSDPCIMVNVEMLTTGFDDPRIQTIVLGRLTYSMNLFWQMIGRGARGPRSGGTATCNVIDPIRLTRMYPIADGYRPTLFEGNDDRVGGENRGLGRLDPSLSVVETQPDVTPPDVVDESWFDHVRLDGEELTAWKEPSLLPETTAPPSFGPPHVPTEVPPTPSGRLEAVLLASSQENLRRVSHALGLPARARQEVAAAVVRSVASGGRPVLTATFDAMLGTEIRALLKTLGLSCPTSTKSAQVVTILYTYVMDDPRRPLRELLTGRIGQAALERTVASGSRVYGLLDARYDKRGLQTLLDALEQPRSAKNKRVLIQRIFETLAAAQIA